MPSSSPATQPAPQRFCVVLSPIRGPEPTLLLRGLQQRGGNIAVVHDAPSVMLSLAQHRIGALIVDEPLLWRVLPELLASVDKYFPSVVCWSHDLSHGKPELRKLDAAALALLTHPPVSTSASHVPHAAGPGPQSASSTSSQQRDVVTNPAWPTDIDPAEPLVTRQEMEMLLAPREPDSNKPTDRTNRGTRP